MRQELWMHRFKLQIKIGKQNHVFSLLLQVMINSTNQQQVVPKTHQLNHITIRASSLSLDSNLSDNYSQVVIFCVFPV